MFVCKRHPLTEKKKSKDWIGSIQITEQTGGGNKIKNLNEPRRFTKNRVTKLKHAYKIQRKPTFSRL